MPTDAEIESYAKSLPTIYRDILAAFPEIEPGRKVGYGLAFQTIAAHFANKGLNHGFDEVQDACQVLADSGFLRIRNGFFAHPTDLGERLIAAVAGQPIPANARVPELPARTW